MKLFIYLFALLVVDHAHAEFACPQDRDIVAGLNKNWETHPQIPRVFHAEFPKVPQGTPVGVIFSWHGVGDSIENWRKAFPLAEHSTPEFPFIVITPHDTDLSPFGGRPGMGWDLFKSTLGDNNLEAMLFESVLGCLSRTHTVAFDRIYSAGFSGGAMVSNMLHARYPNTVAAVFSASGAWMSDERQQDIMHIPFGIRIDTTWVPLHPSDHGAVMMTYGGTDDASSFLMMEILNFRKAALLSKDYLAKNNRTTLGCAHDGGHHLHPGLRILDVVKFFQAHTAAKPSPYRNNSDLPRVLGSVCELN